MMDFQTFLHILKRRFWLILLLPVLAVGLTWLVNSYRTPVYQSNIRMLIYADKTFLEGRDLIYGYYSLDQASIVATFVEMANSRRVYVETMTALGINGPLRDRVLLNTVALPNSTMLELSARGPDANMVEQVANTAGERIVDLVTQYYSGYTVEVLDTAFLPSVPVEPNPVRDSIIAIALSLVLASGLAVLDHYLRQGLNRSKQGGVYDATSSAFTRSYLERRLAESTELKNQEGCLAIIRLNGLKGVKGRMSRQMYERLLHYVVNLMVGELRGKDLVARWNDVSFAVFTPNVTSGEAVRLLEGVQAVLEQPQRFPESGPWIYFDPRIGAVTTGPDHQLASIIQEAEAALVKAGTNGSKPVVATAQFKELREMR